MRKLFEDIKTVMDQGEDVMLCSILTASGSTPRGVGARMAVFADGHVQGTVGGGCVELDAMKLAKEALQKGISLVREYVLTPSETSEIDMVCGGNVTIYFQLLSAGKETDRRWVCNICDILEDREDGWIIYCMNKGTVTEAALYTPVRGICGTGKMTYERIKPGLISRPAVLRGEADIYMEPLQTRRRVWIFGGGHVSHALAPVLAAIQFSVTVYDNRKALAVKSEFPMAEDVIFGDFKSIDSRVHIQAEDYVVIMTPGHQADFEVLNHVLHTPATYIGCIGSSRKVAKTNQLLREAGHSEEDIRRIHSPIGLEIHAETPEEIAISIAAEMIEHRAVKDI